MKPLDTLFDAERSRLEAIGYRLLGTMSDAEDAVQDCYIKWSEYWNKRGGDAIENPKAFLTSSLTRLCLDKLRHRKVEQYKGPWLPEPIQTEQGPDARLDIFQSINTAFLLVLESLSPLERAAFTLYEAFDYSHKEIAALLDITEPHSRQLLSRARRHIAGQDRHSHPAGEEVEALVSAFFLAAQNGDTERFEDILCDDVVAYSDGGGKASAAIIPLEGTDRVITVFSHLINKGEFDVETRWMEVNGQHGLVTVVDGRVLSVTTADVKDGKLFRIYTVRNPDKLRHITLH